MKAQTNTVEHTGAEQQRLAELRVAAEGLSDLVAIDLSSLREGNDRIDFPAHNDAKFLKHSMVRGETVRFF